jgi:hypothetical protein
LRLVLPWAVEAVALEVAVEEEEEEEEPADRAASAC